MPDCIAVRKVTRCQRPINQRDMCAVMIFSFVPHTALEQWNVQGGEILRTDEMDITSLLIVRVPPQNLETHIKSTTRRVCIAGNRRHCHAGHSCNFVAKLFDVSAAFLPSGVGANAYRDFNGHDVVRIVAQRPMQDSLETSYR